MTKITAPKKTAKKALPNLPDPKRILEQRDAGMVAAAAKGESPRMLAKRLKLSTQRVYQVLSAAKSPAVAAKSSKAAPRAKGNALAAVSPVGRAQSLLLRVAVLKEAVKMALNSPGARFTPKLGDEILGALASARMAELAVKEASDRLESVRRRLQNGVIPAKLNGASIGLKAVVRAVKAGQSMKATRA